MDKKSALAITGKQIESSSELATGIGEFFKNRLELSSYIIVGLSKDLNNISFALDGIPDDLSTLIRAILRMAPPDVQKATLKGELEARHKEEEKYIKDL